jgi:hypothetical protein
VSATALATGPRPAGSATASDWVPNLTPGPYWPSFEQFRTAGSTALESIRPGMVGTLSGKTAAIRLLRDDDFQRLCGLASEVHRLKSGVTFLIQAARVVAKHQDKESIEMLVRCASMLGESGVLPEREGHGKFELTAEDFADSPDSGDIDVDNIPRPSIG